MNTDIYPPHTHYAPALHTNVRTTEECTGSIYTVRATRIRTTYKRYTTHTGTQNSHTCTPFTFMQTQTRMHTHTSHTQPYVPMHDKPTTASLHSSASPSFSPLVRPPSSPGPRFFGNSNPLAVHRSVPHLPKLDSTLQVESTYCFLCLFSSLLLFFGLEELNGKWPVNQKMQNSSER